MKIFTWSNWKKNKNRYRESSSSENNEAIINIRIKYHSRRKMQSKNTIWLCSEKQNSNCENSEH